MTKTLARFIRVVLAAVAGFSASQAWSQIVVCNESSDYRYEVALAFYSSADKDIVSHGWWRLEPGKCFTAQSVLKSSTVSLHAKYVPAVQPEKSGNAFMDLMAGMMWVGMHGELTGDSYICGNNEAFKIVGLERCVSRGHEILKSVDFDTRGASRLMLELYEGNKVRWSTR